MFRFTIRELVLLTLVVAMGVGWGMDRTTLASRIQAIGIWKQRADALVHEFDMRGWKVTWEGAFVRIEKGGLSTRIHAGNFDPP